MKWDQRGLTVLLAGSPITANITAAKTARSVKPTQYNGTSNFETREDSGTERAAQEIVRVSSNSIHERSLQYPPPGPERWSLSKRASPGEGKPLQSTCLLSLLLLLFPGLTDCKQKYSVTYKSIDEKFSMCKMSAVFRELTP